jgi:hypothetical protein
MAGPCIGICVCLLIGICLQREFSFDDFYSVARIFRVVNTFDRESETFCQATSGMDGVELARADPRYSIGLSCRDFQV